MINEAIILAGGLGTRLRSIIKNMPKPMANICGKPFLEYIIEYLRKQKIKRVILSVGYKYEIIKEYFGENYKGMDITYVVEKEPLYTGGAIKYSIKDVNSKEVFIINGDTFFNLNLNIFYNLHKNKKAILSIALKKMEFNQRYGVVEINKDNKIIGFFEKNKRNNVLINGGIYIINCDFIQSLMAKEKFSFEKDFLEENYKKYEFYGFPFEEYFIDIGVPEDYERAKIEFEKIQYKG